MAPIHIRAVTPGDTGDWLRMRLDLWPDETRDGHLHAIHRFFAGDRREPKEVLIARDADGQALGFVELSIHNIVDGCSTGHVGFLEGWYVVPAARRTGVGRALVAASEKWARDEGCAEFASDANLDNEISRAAHITLGFEETGAVRKFRKDLP
jgi:aminoglycoside 6'-N-acetyltransferase I